MLGVTPGLDWHSTWHDVTGGPASQPEWHHNPSDATPGTFFHLSVAAAQASRHRLSAPASAFPS